MRTGAPLLALLAWAGLTGAAGGCAASLAGLAGDARADVASVQLRFPTDRTAEARLVLEVGGVAADARGLRATGLDWRLLLRGRPFAVGTQSLEAPVSPGAARVEALLPMAYLPGPVEPREVPLAVEVRGTLTVVGPGGASRQLPFRHAGVVRAAGAPREASERDPVLR